MRGDITPYQILYFSQNDSQSGGSVIRMFAPLLEHFSFNPTGIRVPIRIDKPVFQQGCDVVVIDDAIKLQIDVEALVSKITFLTTKLDSFDLIDSVENQIISNMNSSTINNDVFMYPFDFYRNLLRSYMRTGSMRYRDRDLETMERYIPIPILRVKIIDPGSLTPDMTPRPVSSPGQMHKDNTALLNEGVISDLDMMPPVTRIPYTPYADSYALYTDTQYHKVKSWVNESKPLSSKDSMFIGVDIVRGSPPFTVLSETKDRVLQPLTRVAQTWIHVHNNLWFVCIDGYYDSDTWKPDRDTTIVCSVFSKRMEKRFRNGKQDVR